MARMIPTEFDEETPSFGERQVFESLDEKLPKDYTVFHSFQWNRHIPHHGVQWGEADFIIFHPERGILVLEVKSGGVKLTDGQWWYIRTDNQRSYRMQDPLEQANRTKYRIKDIIEKTLVYPEICWIEPAVWFPSLSDRRVLKSMPNTYHSSIVFTNQALDNPKQAIDDAFDFYNSMQRTRLSTESVTKILSLLAPTCNAVPSLGSMYAEQKAQFLRLTTEQNGLLDYLEEQPNAVVQGSAGTGKTLLAIEKARRLSQSGKVLFLCFNRFLVDEIRQGIANELIDVYNLSQLTKRKTGYIGVPQDDEITHYLTNYDDFKNWDYQHIIIDEGQDFLEEHLSLLASISKSHNGAFYVFYDKNQLIQRFDLPTWIQEAECRLVLRRNCRNTLRIATTAGKPVEVEPVLWEKLPEGQSPSFHILSDRKQVIRAIYTLVSKYVNESIPLNQITIMTVKTEERSILNGITRIGGWSLVNDRREKGLFFTTARKFKGLESAVIILVDVDDSTFSDNVNRSLFYVGASRAKNFLNILALLDDEQKQDLADVLTGKNSVSMPNATIASTLKVKIR